MVIIKYEFTPKLVMAILSTVRNLSKSILIAFELFKECISQFRLFWAECVGAVSQSRQVSQSLITQVRILIKSIREFNEWFAAENREES